ncbi:hypothetical protein EV426DRAFT_612832, partial [Tirmania nivea]
MCREAGDVYENWVDLLVHNTQFEFILFLFPFVFHVCLILDGTCKPSMFGFNHGFFRRGKKKIGMPFKGGVCFPFLYLYIRTKTKKKVST